MSLDSHFPNELQVSITKSSSTQHCLKISKDRSIYSKIGDKQGYASRSGYLAIVLRFSVTSSLDAYSPCSTLSLLAPQKVQRW